MEVVRKIGRDDVEPVSNSFFQAWLQDSQNPLVQAKLTELLVLENIPNYLTPKGPYHKCIEEARRNPYLVDFRRWITQQSLSANKKELRDVKREVEAEIRKTEDEIFLKCLDSRTRYLSIGKTLLNKALDLALPFSSLTVKAAEEVANYFEAKQRRWQGFVVSARRSAHA
jgi:hypothetical protein